MGFFEKLFSKEKTTEMAAIQKKASPEVSSAPSDDAYERAGITFPVSKEETEIVSIISSAAVAGDYPDSKIRVTRVLGIDTEKEAAGIIAAAIAADSYPNKAFRLRSVKEQKSK